MKMFLKRILNRFIRQFKIFVKYGPSSIVDDLINGTRVWSLKNQSDSILTETGSISGTDSGYLGIVRASLVDDISFSKFKANREYREILEHVDREFGMQYLNVIKRYGNSNPDLINFLKMDFCKPFRYTYGGLGRVSPSNLRYGKVALDLRALFGSLDNFRVSEIGIGYGGQLHALSMLSKLSTYSFYDLPQVTQLASQYLSRQAPNLNFYKSGNFMDQSSELDLVISNYAFSELDRTLQEIYMKNVVSRSKRGYFIYNDISKGAFETMSVLEFAERIPGAIIVNEYPLTHKKNCLVIWGHDDLSQLILSE